MIGGILMANTDAHTFNRRSTISPCTVVVRKNLLSSAQCVICAIFFIRTADRNAQIIPTVIFSVYTNWYAGQHDLHYFNTYKLVTWHTGNTQSGSLTALSCRIWVSSNRDRKISNQVIFMFKPWKASIIHTHTATLRYHDIEHDTLIHWEPE